MFTQHTRLLRIRVPTDENLVVERMEIREGVSSLFAMDIDCLAHYAELDTACLLGQEISLDILLADESTRTWHGVVHDVAALGSDGGLTRYRLQAGPWLGALALRRDSFVFQDKTAQDILAEVFADYPQAAYAFEIGKPLPARPIRTQYRESDLDFILRVMAEDGLAFRFEHEQNENSENQRAGARHRLVVFDAQAVAPECDASPIRFHANAATQADDAIEYFAVQRAAQATATVRTIWDDVALAASVGNASTRGPGDYEPSLEDYLAHGHASSIDNAIAQGKADTAQAVHDSRRVRFMGYGGARALVAGHVFRLMAHDRYDAMPSMAENGNTSRADARAGDGPGGRYTVLSVSHRAANNLGTQVAAVLRSHDLERGTYRNRFTAQPDMAGLTSAQAVRCTAPEAMEAVVMAAEGSALGTGRDLRVKVQFPWQRGTRPLGGGLSHVSRSDAKGNAPGDLGSGTWMRSATAVAGPNWGMHVPVRGGTDVLVSFLDSDIDQPVVAAQLYNDADAPPWPAGEGSTANHPGTLTGWHSRNLSGDGYNQWLFDDATGQLRMRLSSSAAAAQLGLGHLVEQQAESPRRGSWRGTGFELRSDAWVVVRSGQGMLLSTQERGMAQSTIADCSEALSLLQAARDTARRLDSAAAQAGNSAMPVNGYFSDFIDGVNPEAGGRYASVLNGQRAIKAQGNDRDGQKPVERLDGARMLIDTPVSAAFTTPADVSLYAGGDSQMTSQSDTHVAAESAFCAVADAAVALFAQQGGIRGIAATGRLSLQAQADELELLAGRDITVLSSNGEIEISAKESITLTAANAAVTLQGGNVMFHCPGAFSVRGGLHRIEGPIGGRDEDIFSTAIATASSLSSTVERTAVHGKCFQFLDSDTNLPLSNRRYLGDVDGIPISGVTDNDGFAYIDAPKDEPPRE